MTGVVHPDKLVTNAGLRAGQVLVLTKPLGTGIIATAYKAGLASPEAVEASVSQMTALNLPAAEVMEACGVRGGTDITGFGLLGHALEMAAASGVRVVIEAGRVPVLPQARDMALTGLVPMGSHANRQYCSKSFSVQGQADAITLDLLSDAQTSGGMLMGLDPDQVDTALGLLQDRGARGWVVGRVEPGPPGTALVVF